MKTAYSCLRCTARAQGEAVEELRGTVQALAAQLEELRVRAFVITGLDYWTGLLDWTTGL